MLLCGRPRTVRPLLTMLFAAALCTASVSRGFDFFQPLSPPRAVQVVARGGLARLAPAGGRQAIALCIDDALEWVGVEVYRTKDGQHVIFDGPALDGRSSGTGLISEHSLAELQQLDAGSWFAKRFKAARILTLDECLEQCKGKINVCLDCRQADAAILVQAVKSTAMERQVLVHGNLELLKRVNELATGAVATMPSWQMSDEPAAWLDTLRPAVVQIEAPELSSDVCRQLHARGVKVLVRLAESNDGPPAWDQTLAAGVDLVDTHLPEEFVAHLLNAQIPSRPVRLTCHRGASRYAPENTLPAFDKAYRLHADFVEFDVRPSQDGSFYLLHDGQLDRTTNGHGPIRDTPSAMVDMLDAGSWFGKPFAGLRVPTLDAFLAAVPPGVSLYFDAKDIPPEALAAAINKYHLAERTVVYQSADYLAKLKAVDKRIRLMPPAGSTAEVDRLATSLRPYAVDTRWTALSKQYIDHCHAAGIQVFADAPFFVDVKGYRRAIDWGIDVIQTDHPLRLWRAIELTAAERGKP